MGKLGLLSDGRYSCQSVVRKVESTEAQPTLHHTAAPACHKKRVSKKLALMMYSL